LLILYDIALSLLKTLDSLDLINKEITL